MRSYIKDYKGLEYKTFGEMCKVYGKTEKLVRFRLENNWNLKDALTKKSSVSIHKYKKVKSDVILDSDGNIFSSLEDLCKYYKKSVEIVSGRLDRGWSLKDALFISSRDPGVIMDRNGVWYDSIGDMCKYWGTSAVLVRDRLKLGWSVKDALELKVGSRVDKYKDLVEDHLGKSYKSRAYMCYSYGKDEDTVNRRLRKGWTLRDALEVPIGTIKVLGIEDGRYRCLVGRVNEVVLSNDLFVRCLKLGVVSNGSIAKDGSIKIKING